MITVTERAKEELKRMLSTLVDNPQAGLRLTASNPGEFGLSIDVEMPGDQVINHEDSKVLIVENGLADSLTGITLDIKDTPEGPQFVVLEGD